MTYAGWRIDRLRFTGPNDKEALLDFSPGLNLIYGASNTGKSFAVKSLDFMLGSGKELPDIQERQPYNTVWLDMMLVSNQKITLERGILGGAFRLYEGDTPPIQLNPRPDQNNPANISTFLLAQLGIAGKKLSVNQSGNHGNLTFRDIANLVMTDETEIQAENSPIESGNIITLSRERNVFKFLLTGEDDSAIIPIIKSKDFNTGQSAKSSILQEMIDQINTEIIKDYPETDGLTEQADRINATLRLIESEMVSARSSIRELLDEKRKISLDISIAERRSVNVALSLDSFKKLEEVYSSDIARLEALEEAGFLLGLDSKMDCPICGAPQEAQVHQHDLAGIEDMRVAAEIEIQKIKQQREELVKTVEDTKNESVSVAAFILRLRKSLAEVERKLEEATPNADEQQRRLSDVVEIRDRVRRGLDLIARRDKLVQQKQGVEASKAPKRDKTIQRGLSTEIAKEFADVVSHVLTQWGFPGENQVFFDPSTYDLVIDGKQRRNNGKGVRAITHAAFKVALLLFCRERDLPHPGFLVLDTPLMTYRDPMKKPNDRLTEDEKALRKTDLKHRFFNHLGDIGEKAQIIIFENVDPPQDIMDYCHVEVFTNDPANEGRSGLL